MRRREFLAATAATAAAAQTDYRTSTQAGAVPDYERPLFNLAGLSRAPVKLAKLELLRNGRNYFVRASSTDGATGVARTKQVEEHLSVLTRLAIPFFAGKDARNLESLCDEYYVRNYKLGGQGLWAPYAYCEQAVFDLLGKTVGKSVGAMMGGVIRRKVPVYLSGSGRETTAEQEVEVYRQALGISGAKAMKFKIGGRMSRNADASPGRTEKMVELARKTYGDQTLIYVDANGSYNAAKAIEIGRWLERLNVAFFEEPCPWEELEETKRVADSLRIPVAAGEQDSSLWKFQHMIETRGLDIVQPDLNYNGGFIRAARVARMARAAKISIVPHNTQTGVAACNILQFASCIPNIGPYMEFPFRGKADNESWFSPHFVIRDGALDVPPGPGLGVEIDPAYLAAAQVVTA